MSISRISLCCVALFSFCLGMGQGRADEISRQSHFSVHLPDGFKILKESPLDDFDIYTIAKDGRVYVRMYLGNHPDFPKRVTSPDSEVAEFEFGNVRAKAEWRAGVLMGRELRLGLSSKVGWPSVLHAWTTAETPGEVVVADRILSSLKEIVEKPRKLPR